VALRVVTHASWRAGDLLLPIGPHRRATVAGLRLVGGTVRSSQDASSRLEHADAVSTVSREPRSVQLRQIFALGCNGRASPSASLFHRFCTIGCILPVQLITQGRADRTRALRAPSAPGPTGRRARGGSGALYGFGCGLSLTGRPALRRARWRSQAKPISSTGCGSCSEPRVETSRYAAWLSAGLRPICLPFASRTTSQKAVNDRLFGIDPSRDPLEKLTLAFHCAGADHGGAGDLGSVRGSGAAQKTAQAEGDLAGAEVYHPIADRSYPRPLVNTRGVRSVQHSCEKIEIGKHECAH
jgi:hypothetical protein